MKYNSPAENFDVIIAGSGPAGTACALALKDSGLRMALVDKHSFPRDKVCGDAIGGRALSVLNAIDRKFGEAFKSFPRKQISSGWKLVSPSGRSASVGFVNPGYVSTRLEFDNFLLQLVKEHTDAVVIENDGVKEVFMGDDAVNLITSKGRRLSSQVVSGCDGAHSAIARCLHDKNGIDHAHYSGAVRAYYRGIRDADDGLIEIHLLKGFLPGYFWIFPLGNNMFNAGFGMLSSEISRRKIDLKHALRTIVSQGKLAERFDGSEMIGEVRGFGLPLGGMKRSISGERYLLCGDAASLIDPLNGEGIGNAMLSGMLAARHIMTCFEKDDFSARRMKGYDEMVYKRLLPELQKKLLLQKLFNRPWLIEFLMQTCGRSEYMKRWIGKHL